MFVRTWADRGTYCSITHSSEELKTAQMCPAGEWMNAQDIAQPWIMAEWSVVGNRVSWRPRWPWSPPVVLFLLLRSTTIGLYCHALAKIDFYLLHRGPLYMRARQMAHRVKGLLPSLVTWVSSLGSGSGRRANSCNFWKLSSVSTCVLWHICTWTQNKHMNMKYIYVCVHIYT